MGEHCNCPLMQGFNTAARALNAAVAGGAAAAPPAHAARCLSKAQALVNEVLRVFGAGAAAGEPEVDPEARPGDIAEIYGTQGAWRGAGASGEPERAGGGRLHWQQAGRNRAALLNARPAPRVQQQ